jgi:hypothetical protein
MSEHSIPHGIPFTYAHNLMVMPHEHADEWIPAEKSDQLMTRKTTISRTEGLKLHLPLVTGLAETRGGLQHPPLHGDAVDRPPFSMRPH